MKTQLLEQTIVEEIARIGRDRSPAEACGILLPTPFKHKRVWEMPNRSRMMHDTFEMHGDDIAIAVGEYDGNFEEMAIWHTHPAGGLGPSREDMTYRHERVANLVVTLLPDNVAKATWY